jgi:phenylpropionate dioxygenase-like ring-hydroxylating dioxygenase large terminal subunit
MSQAVTVRPLAELLSWPPEGFTRVPLHVHSDPEIYAWEQDLIFRGPAWHFLGLEVEIPQPGDYITSFVGDTSVIVIRSAAGAINALVNRCAHKGTTVCYEPRGNKPFLTCPYHNWIYDHDGNLTSVAFERGIKELGGMPADFDKARHGLRRLRVECLSGLVFATFSDAAPSLEDYLGPLMVQLTRRTIGKKMKILGRYSQLMDNNWKLYAENTRDTYHPSLLHAFFATFKLNRLSAEGGVRQDDRNWHHVVFAKRQTDEQHAEYDSGKIRAMKTDFGLRDPSLIDQWMEFDDGITNFVQNIFPGFVLQQVLNSIGTRQILPKGPHQCELVWTLVGFEDDDADQTYMRVKQSNLIGPAGFVSMEDGIIGSFVERGIRGDLDASAVVEMGGRDVGSAQTRATETSVRGFWHAYRQLMGV